MDFKDNIEFKKIEEQQSQPEKKQTKKISNEQQNKYSKSFYENHKGEKIMCNVCQIEYSKFNKSHHMNGKLHKQIVKLMNKE